MSFLNLLGNMMGGIAQPDPAMPYDMSDASSRIANWNPPEQQAAPQSAQMPKLPHHSTLSNILGALGDALLAAHGRQAIYRPQIEQEKLGATLASSLGNSDPNMMALAQQDPETFLKVWQAKNTKANMPETIQLLQAAGIDPTSEQGRQAILGKLGGDGGSDPSFIRELQAAGIDPRSAEGVRLIYGHNSPAGYLLTPPSGGGQSGGLPTFKTPQEAQAAGLAPGSRFMGPNGHIYRMPGGATGSTSSPTFSR